MRQLIEDPRSARATGRAARERVVSSLSWRHAADAADERLARIVERPIWR